MRVQVFFYNTFDVSRIQTSAVQSPPKMDRINREDCGKSQWQLEGLVGKTVIIVCHYNGWERPTVLLGQKS